MCARNRATSSRDVKETRVSPLPTMVISPSTTLDKEDTYREVSSETTRTPNRARTNGMKAWIPEGTMRKGTRRQSDTTETCTSGEGCSQSAKRPGNTSSAGTPISLSSAWNAVLPYSCESGDRPMETLPNSLQDRDKKSNASEAGSTCVRDARRKRNSTTTHEGTNSWTLAFLAASASGF